MTFSALRVCQPQQQQLDTSELFGESLEPLVGTEAKTRFPGFREGSPDSDVPLKSGTTEFHHPVLQSQWVSTPTGVTVKM